MYECAWPWEIKPVRSLAMRYVCDPKMYAISRLVGATRVANARAVNLRHCMMMWAAPLSELIVGILPSQFAQMHFDSETINLTHACRRGSAAFSRPCTDPEATHTAYAKI